MAVCLEQRSTDTSLKTFPKNTHAAFLATSRADTICLHMHIQHWIDVIEGHMNHRAMNNISADDIIIISTAWYSNSSFCSIVSHGEQHDHKESTRRSWRSPASQVFLLRTSNVSLLEFQKRSKQFLKLCLDWPRPEAHVCYGVEM